LVYAWHPAQSTYFEIAEKLSKKHLQRVIYKKWIQFYSSVESYKQVKQIKMILDAWIRKQVKLRRVFKKYSI
jgi:thiaminase